MMKRYLLGACVLAFSAMTASAIVTQLTPSGTEVLSTYYINKNGTGIGDGNSNNTENNLYRLRTYFLADLCEDVESLKPASQSYDWSGGGLGDWDYAVIHYGAGSYGGSGGSVAAYALNGEDSFVFPNGSFSSIDLFRCDGDRVPDGGATVAMLGLGMIVLTQLRKRIAA